MVDALYNWFDTRLGISGSSRKLLNKIFPDHWSFLIGEIALYSFIVLLGTGVAGAAATHTVWISKGAGAVAAGLVAGNIFGGCLVTQRMLAMYKKKERPKDGAKGGESR